MPKYLSKAICLPFCCNAEVAPDQEFTAGKIESSIQDLSKSPRSLSELTAEALDLSSVLPSEKTNDLPTSDPHDTVETAKPTQVSFSPCYPDKIIPDEVEVSISPKPETSSSSPPSAELGADLSKSITSSTDQDAELKTAETTTSNDGSLNSSDSLSRIISSLTSKDPKYDVCQKSPPGKPLRKPVISERKESEVTTKESKLGTSSDSTGLKRKPWDMEFDHDKAITINQLPDKDVLEIFNSDSNQQLVYNKRSHTQQEKEWINNGFPENLVSGKKKLPPLKQVDRSVQGSATHQGEETSASRKALNGSFSNEVQNAKPVDLTDDSPKKLETVSANLDSSSCKSPPSTKKPATKLIRSDKGRESSPYKQVSATHKATDTTIESVNILNGERAKGLSRSSTFGKSDSSRVLPYPPIGMKTNNYSPQSRKYDLKSIDVPRPSPYLNRSVQHHRVQGLQNQISTKQIQESSHVPAPPESLPPGKPVAAERQRGHAPTSKRKSFREPKCTREMIPMDMQTSDVTVSLKEGTSTAKHSPLLRKKLSKTDFTASFRPKVPAPPPIPRSSRSGTCGLNRNSISGSQNMNSSDSSSSERELSPRPAWDLVKADSINQANTSPSFSATQTNRPSSSSASPAPVPVPDNAEYCHPESYHHPGQSTSSLPAPQPPPNLMAPSVFPRRAGQPLPPVLGRSKLTGNMIRSTKPKGGKSKTHVSFDLPQFECKTPFGSPLRQRPN